MEPVLEALEGESPDRDAGGVAVPQDSPELLPGVHQVDEDVLAGLHGSPAFSESSIRTPCPASRMEKRHALAAGARDRGRVDEPEAPGSEVRQGRFEVLDREADVVDSLAAPRQELRDGESGDVGSSSSIRLSPTGRKAAVTFWDGTVSRRVSARSERAIDVHRAVDRRHGHAQVIDLVRAHPREPAVRAPRRARAPAARRGARPPSTGPPGARRRRRSPPRGRPAQARALRRSCETGSPGAPAGATAPAGPRRLAPSPDAARCSPCASSAWTASGTPAAVGAEVFTIGGPPGVVAREVEHHRSSRDRAVGAVAVGLVDDEDVGDLEDAGLDRLDVVAHARAPARRRRCRRRARCRPRPAPRPPSRRGRRRSPRRRARRRRRRSRGRGRPGAPRVAIERMKTPGSVACSCMRIAVAEDGAAR